MILVPAASNTAVVAWGFVLLSMFSVVVELTFNITFDMSEWRKVSSRSHRKTHGHENLRHPRVEF